HMRMDEPVPRGHPKNYGYRGVDYDLNAPLNDPSLGGSYPCKHQRLGPVTAVFKAGGYINTRFGRGNPHKGGHCQFALSYDNGRNWVVLRTVVATCFLGHPPYMYRVRVPKGARNGRAVFAWTWVSAEGKREFYMNCADIRIRGGSNRGALTGPELLVTQLPGYPRVPE
ncbi:putative endoglucanase precursor, partial [Thamnocephalis sphaerospora]